MENLAFGSAAGKMVVVGMVGCRTALGEVARLRAPVARAVGAPFPGGYGYLDSFVRAFVYGTPGYLDSSRVQVEALHLVELFIRVVAEYSCRGVKALCNCDRG